MWPAGGVSAFQPAVLSVWECADGGWAADGSGVHRAPCGSDDALGLYYYGSRYYDPLLGRFAQADTVVSNPGNPQSFNRYSYVLNNPLRYVDPTGYVPDPACVGTYIPDCGIDDDEPSDDESPLVPPQPPPGMGADGPAGYAGIAALASQQDAWWGATLSPLEAVAIVLRFEVSTAIYKDETGWHMNPTALEAATRKYNQFCSGGAWSAACFSGFWGYYQPIIDAATSASQIEDILDDDLYTSSGGVYMTSAGSVINNPGLGGQVRTRPTGWVTLYAYNDVTYKSAKDLSQGSASNQAFYIYKYRGLGNTPIFLILSIDQQIFLCGGSLCNLTDSR